MVVIPFGVIGLILIHIACLGYWGVTLLRYASRLPACQVATLAGLGFTLFGLEMGLLGHLAALTRPVLLLSGLIMAVGLLRPVSQRRALLAAFPRRLLAILREDRLLAFSCVIFLLCIFLAGMRPPQARDEIEYHWAAPLFWAQAGRWETSPFRLTNGPALLEMIYTFSAVFSSPAAAHWTHSLLLLVLLLGAASLAQAIGGSRLAAIAACLSIPVLTGQASIAYNDVGAAALIVCAYAALLCPRRNQEGRVTARWAGPAAAGLLLAGALSIKPLTAAALPVACCLAAFPPGERQRAPISASVRAALVLLLPAALFLGFWFWHTRTLTGKIWDNSGVHLARTPADPMWRSGAAAGRIPSLRDMAVLPFVPILSSIFGQREPYGGRTGLLLLVYTPLGLAALRHRTDAERQRAHWLIAAAVVYFLLLGPVAIKTRFHLFVWTACACLAAVAYQDLLRNRASAVSRIGLGGFYLCLWIGMADAGRKLLGAFLLKHASE
ncbi:MAG TPA: hypothetical protein VFB21_11745 [Chthonomonadaceae bacterium]|nr:hypothetical protein [Chthonomonadaceae bacterium]